MPRFAANVNFLFGEYAELDRFRAASQAGFRAVEFPYPYGHSPGQLADALQREGLRLVLMNTSAGEASAGEHGFACLPDRDRQFRESVSQALDHAAVLACPTVHVLAGIQPIEPTFEAVYRTYVDRVVWASEQAAGRGIGVTIEAINGRDVPNYFLKSPRMAMQVIRDAGVGNLYLQYDVYHAQVTEGDLTRSLEACFPRIRHIQIADPPLRHEPGTGEINYPYFFRLIDQLGYKGWIGCEYRPQGRTEEGLGWLQPYLSRPNLE